MSGRKTIMVDEGVWNKVEELKHDARLRSSGDAIEAAVDIASSDKYYAGIKAQTNGSGLLSYVVESLGRTEDEAVHNLLKLEQGGVYGNLRSEDVPPADETDIDECGFFVVECTKNLYHAGKLFGDPETWKEEAFGEEAFPYRNLFSCTISKSKNGTLIADIQETDGHSYYVLIDRPKYGNVARIVGYGTSPVGLHSEFIVDYTQTPQEFYDPFVHDDDDSKVLYSSYNAGNYEVFPCTPRLFAECVGHSFQSEHFLQLEVTDQGPRFPIPPFHEYYGIICEDENPITEETTDVVDTTPENHYYVVLRKVENKTYMALNVGNSANNASNCFRIEHPIYIDVEYGVMQIIPGERVWSSVKANGERTGNYNGQDVYLVECTVEVYAKYLMKKENEDVLCTIDEIDGEKIAKFEKYEIMKTNADNPSPAKKSSTKKTTTAKSTPAKKTGGKK